MDKEGFIDFLKKKKKSKRTIDPYVGYVQQFAAFLSEQKNGKQLEKAGRKDLRDFEIWGDRQGFPVNQALWGIKEYSAFVMREALKLEANAMLGERYLSRFKWKDFIGSIR